MTAQSEKDRIFAALIFIQILFGMNYVFSKVVLGHLPALLWAATRAAATAVILLSALVALKKVDLPSVSREWKTLLGLSLLGVALNQGCFLLGLKLTTPTNSALLNTLIPVFTILLVTLLGHEESSRQRELGFFSALIGVLALHRIEQFSSNPETLLGDLLTLLNALFYSIFLAVSSRFFARHDFVWATTWLFVFGSVALAIMAYPEWKDFTPERLPPEVWLCGIITVIAGTIIPYLLISFTLGRAPSSTVALFVYLQPIVTAILSFLFFHERIGPRTILSAGLIFLGVALATVNLSKKKKPTLDTADQKKTDRPPLKRVS